MRSATHATLAAFGIVTALIAATVSIANADNAEEEYLQSLKPSLGWELPTTGPAAQDSKNVQFIAASLRNSGILGVAEGVREASEAIGWNTTIDDARGSDEAIKELLEAALASPPDGLILGGFDANAHASLLERLRKAGTQIVGWHAGPVPGPIQDAPVFYNVTTDPLIVARVAAQHAIARSDGKVGAVIFTDSRFGIATTKSDEMKRVVEACDTCRLLEVIDLRLDETATEMPKVVDMLLAKYGDEWSASLGINDLYFDDAVVAFSLAGIPPSGRISNISAGDGSLTAYQRVRLNNYQAATVPEPLNFQGWQIVDELNRAMAGEDPSGFVAPTKLVIPENVDEDGGSGNIFDPSNNYRESYLAVWRAGG